VLREEGITERAIFVIDKAGIVRYIDIHDINSEPELEPVLETLEDLR
jgi:peroxiredoxin